MKSMEMKRVGPNGESKMGFQRKGKNLALKKKKKGIDQLAFKAMFGRVFFVVATN